MSSHNLYDLWKDLQDRLIELLLVIQKEETQLLQRATRSKIACKNALIDLQNSINKLDFKSDQEIYFYKDVKPFVWGHLLFYTRIYDIEINKPPGTIEDLDDYYRKELKNIKEFFEDQRFIYRYIRSGSTHLDDKLFFDPVKHGSIALSSFESYPDESFPLCYDFIISRIKAGNLLQNHLFTLLDELHRPGHLGTPATPLLTWTDSKTGLIELAYALQSAGVLNNGKVELKEIVDFFQEAFHVNLGHYPRTFQEILSRKTGYTNFIDKLRDKLLLRIQTIEEKYDR